MCFDNSEIFQLIVLFSIKKISLIEKTNWENALEIFFLLLSVRHFCGRPLNS